MFAHRWRGSCSTGGSYPTVDVPVDGVDGEFNPHYVLVLYMYDCGNPKT